MFKKLGAGSICLHHLVINSIVVGHSRKKCLIVSLLAGKFPRILQNVHPGSVNPSIACIRSFVKSWLFLNLNKKSLKLLCRNGKFHEESANLVMSTIGICVPVEIAKVLTILSPFGFAFDNEFLDKMIQNFFDPFLIFLKKSPIFSTKRSVSSSFLKRLRILMAASCSLIQLATNS